MSNFRIPSESFAREAAKAVSWPQPSWIISRSDSAMSGQIQYLTTTATLKTRGGVPIMAAKITSYSFGDGGLNREYEGTAGHQLVIEGAIELRGPWHEIGRTTSGDGKGATGFIPDFLGPVGFVRVVTR